MSLVDKIKSFRDSFDPKKAYGGEHFWEAGKKVTYLGKKYKSAVHNNGEPCLLYSKDGSSFSPAGGPFNEILASHKVCGENYLKVLKGLPFDGSPGCSKLEFYAENGEQVFKGNLHCAIKFHEIGGNPYLESAEGSDFSYKNIYTSRDGKRFDYDWEIYMVSPLLYNFDDLGLSDKFWETYTLLRDFIKDNSDQEKFKITEALSATLCDARANFKTEEEAKVEMGLMLEQLKYGITKNPQKFLKEMGCLK